MSDKTTGGAELSPIKRALLAVDQMKAKLDAYEQARTEPIAVVGIGCRFPDADGPDAYWRLLRDGVNAVREVPRDRWDIDAYFDPDPAAAGKMYTKWAGFLDRVDQFDPQFFGIAPREAVGMDPQQRLLLEVCWEALEHAGERPDALHGTPTGVFLGMVACDYATMQTRRNDLTAIDAYSQSGLSFSIASGRVSYVLGLQGPSMTVDTACSSSLVAVHLACQSLRLGECRMALAAGVHLILLPDNSVCYSRARMLAADGRCKAFDASADGFVEGEGCGVVVLKRLSDAVADGDRIYAVIRGSAVNQDGPSGGLTVPNGPSQEAVVREALARGGVDPARVGYIEAHGTGTSLGDPIEARALGAVFGTARADRIALGSVKTNIGHLQGAAGIAGLIKLVLALHYEAIPPHLHFATPSPHIPWDRLPLAVPTALTPWPRGEHRRAGGVSAFGFSGTNAHVVVEEAPPVPAAVPVDGIDRPLHVLTLSARSDAALHALAGRWAGAIGGLDDTALPDVCFTANTGRAQLPHRAAVAVASRPDLIAQLQALATGGERASIARGVVTSSDRPKIAFLFTGQGAQSPGMGRRLFDTHPVFREALERCDAALRPHMDRPLLSVLYPELAGDCSIDQTVYTQPALFAIEYALSELWRSWGVTPTAVLGHSLGEYVAATVAGVFTVERALALVAARARLMQSLPAGGSMAAVLADEARVAAAIAAEGGTVAIAAINGPRQVVISGVAADVAAVVQRLSAGGIGAELLTVSHAFHSPLMDPILDAFADAVRAAEPGPPTLAVVSNLTGQVARHELKDPSYWRRHLREPVRFADGITTLHAMGYRLFVELGPKPVLTAMGQRCAEGGTWLPSLRHGRDDWEVVLGTLRELHARGAGIDWAGFDRPWRRRRVALPTYPFERSRYWVSDEPSSPRLAPRAAVTSRHPLLGDALRTAPGPVVFARAVSAGELRYLADHRKHGAAIFPATAYLEMGLAAAADVFGSGAHCFDDLMISSPVVLPDDAPVELQVVVTPSGNEAAFQLFSLDGEAGTWQLHATGALRRGAAVAPAHGGLDDLRRSCPERADPSEYYAAMAADGHEYGPAFQAIRELWRGPMCAAGRLELAAGDADQAGRYLLHPVLLDAATQMIGAALPSPGEGAARETYLPVTLERVTVYSAGASRGWGEVRVRQADAATRTLAADVRLLDDDGRVVAAIDGMYLKPFSRDALAARASAVGEWLHEIGWAPMPLAPADLTPARSGTWVVFADCGGVGEAIARERRSGGGRCAVITRGPGEPAADAIAVDPLDPGGVRDAYRRAAAGGPVQGVIYLWALDAEAPGHSADRLAPDAPGGSAGLLHVVQAIAAEHETERPRLWVVTRGAQPVDGAPPAVEQAATLGLARSIAAEYPDLRCACVDLPRASAAGADARLLAAEVDAGDAEEQVAYRDGVRHAARLRRLSEPARAVDGPFALDIGTRGLLDTLALAPLARRAPGHGEVEVRVVAAGLNFRDVLNALGMYEGPAGPLGSEFVGVVTARGEGVPSSVDGLVMGMAAGAFRTHLCVPASTVAQVPDGLLPEEAATLPVVFLTAVYGLQHLAGLRAGERVLIHAGAGGVGLAAIQVAQRAGAEIFATAGSDEKREYLRRLGVGHVYSSRTLEFGSRIREATGGAGVDVILNSLNGDFIAESVGALARGGRFIEIGKAGIWTAERMAAARPDVRYFPLYLGDVGPATLQALYGDLRAAIASRELTPLPHKSYALADARQAFRFMAQARHIGKLVLRAPEDERPAVRPDATYLVTGAFGGLGAQVARWLADEGARHLALVGRQGAASPGAAALLAELEGRGVTVRSHAADVGDAAAMSGVFEAIGADAPLRGVVHAAGVLDDAVLEQQSLPRLARVFGPKVGGAWILHQHTKDRPLDFFAMFSSMVTVVGAPGQGNYAAANAALDALAHHRRALGLAGVTINWGPWSDVGMSAGVSRQDRQRWQRQGISFISGREGLEALGRVLRGAAAQVAVLPVQWRVLLQQFPPGGVPPLYAELAAQLSASVSTPQAAAQVDLPALLKDVPAARAPRVVLRHVTELAFKVLGLDDATVVDPQRPLQEYGLDSLMAVELRNALGGLMGRTLPATLLFKYPTVQALADFVLESVPAVTGDAAAVESRPAPAADEAEIESLSDADVKRMLADELASLSAAGWAGDDDRTDA